MTTPTRSACAWCGVELRPGPEPTSHDICEPCADALKAGYLPTDDPELSREHARRLKAKVALAMAQEMDEFEQHSQKVTATCDKVLILVGLAVSIPVVVMLLVLAWKLWEAK